MSWSSQIPNPFASPTVNPFVQNAIGAAGDQLTTTVDELNPFRTAPQPQPPVETSIQTVIRDLNPFASATTTTASAAGTAKPEEKGGAVQAAKAKSLEKSVETASKPAPISASKPTGGQRLPPEAYAEGEGPRKVVEGIGLIEKARTSSSAIR